MDQSLWEIPEVLFEKAGHGRDIPFGQQVHLLTTLEAMLQGLHGPHVPIHSEQALLMKGYSTQKRRNLGSYYIHQIYFNWKRVG